jgi:site-specific recombinase XerD
MVNRQLPLFPSQPTTPAEITKASPIGATLELFQRFLSREGKSPHTVKAFMADMILLCDYTNENTPVGKYNTSILNDFLDWMEHRRGVSCSRKTYARRVTTLKVYFKWLRAINAISHDPALAVLQRSGPAPLAHVLNPEQIEAIIKAARRQKKGDEHDFRPELLFQLLLQTGMKKSEAGDLKLEDIDRSHPNRPTLIIKHKVKNIYKERRLELSPDFLPLLDAYVAQYQIMDKLFTCTTRNLEYILTDLGEEAGVPFKISFEGLRWTLGVRDLRFGTEEEIIREKLGLSQTSWYETGQKIRRLVAQQIADENQAV